MSQISRIGLPPGTPVYIGKKNYDQEVIITHMAYSPNLFQEQTLDNLDANFRDDLIHWINIEGLNNIDIIRSLGLKFKIDPIILEDIVDTTQRPKMDDQEDYLHIIIKSFDLDESNYNISSEHISFILGQNYLITFQEFKGDTFESIRERIRGNKGPIRKYGSDYLFNRIIDNIIDNYFVILEPLNELIENLDDEVIKEPTRQTLSKIQNFKRTMIHLRRDLIPIREILVSLLNSDNEIMRSESYTYLKSIYDHSLHVISTIDNFRETLTNQLDIYLSNVSNRTNDIMMFLTLITSIFIPLSFIAGVYGMNFQYMPELAYRFGYFIILSLMLGIATTMILYFRRKKWL